MFKKAKPGVIKSARNDISDKFFARNVSEMTANNNWSFFRDGIHKEMENNIHPICPKPGIISPGFPLRILESILRDMIFQIYPLILTLHACI